MSPHSYGAGPVWGPVILGRNHLTQPSARKRPRCYRYLLARQWDVSPPSWTRSEWNGYPHRWPLKSTSKTVHQLRAPVGLQNYRPLGHGCPYWSWWNLDIVQFRVNDVSSLNDPGKFNLPLNVYSRWYWRWEVDPWLDTRTLLPRSKGSFKRQIWDSGTELGMAWINVWGGHHLSFAVWLDVRSFTELPFYTHWGAPAPQMAANDYLMLNPPIAPIHRNGICL